MKTFFNRLSKRSKLLLVIIFVAATAIRFYNYSHRVSFSSEQARSLIVSSGYLKKPSLLGQDYFIGHDSNGHVLFAGALFNYLLVPAVLITPNVVPITVLFTLLNLATGYLIYWVGKKVFGEGVGIISALIFLFSDYMIYHSLFVWIYNPLPLIGISTAYLLYLYTKKQKVRYVLMTGFLSGVGISLQYLYAPVALAVGVFVIWKSRKKPSTIFAFAAAGAFANLPMIIFDLRHNFYNLQTILQMFLDALAGRGNAETNYFVYYHFFPFWPLFAIAGGWILMKIYKVNKWFCLTVIAVYLFLNISSPRVNFNGPTSTPGGLYVSQIDEASRQITLDTKGPFNVVEVLDFDKQAFMLRYFVEYKYGKRPMDIESYPNAKTLYVLAPKNYDFSHTSVWEIYSGGQFETELFYSINNSYAIFKLSRG